MRNKKQTTKPFYMNFRSLEEYMIANNKFLQSIGFDSDTLEDLHSRGIKTPQDLEYSERLDAYIDLHKTLEGFSPRTKGLSLKEITQRYNSLREVA
jgi:hypothetical protein